MEIEGWGLNYLIIYLVRKISTADRSCACLKQTGTRDHCSCLVCPFQESANIILVQQQLQMFARQRRNAEAMLAQTGDTSGLLAALASASQCRGSWDSFGTPRFRRNLNNVWTIKNPQRTVGSCPIGLSQTPYFGYGLCHSCPFHKVFGPPAPGLFLV